MPAPSHAVNSPLSYVNRALALLGEDFLTDLIPESGATNAAAAMLYDAAVDHLLSCFEWRFATRIASLSQLADTAPSPWVAQYNLPANTLRVLDTDVPGEHFTIASNHDFSDEEGTRRLYAMRTGVRARVVVRPLDETFPPHFWNALVFRLAADLAPSITGNLTVAAAFDQKAERALSEAKVLDYNENPSVIVPSMERDPRSNYADSADWFPWTGGY